MKKYPLYSIVKHKVWKGKEKTYLVRIIGYCKDGVDVLVEFLNPAFVTEYNLHNAIYNTLLVDADYRDIKIIKKEENVYYYVPTHSIVGYANLSKRRKITIRLPKITQHDRIQI